MADPRQQALDAFIAQQDQPPQAQNPAVAPGVSVSFTGQRDAAPAANDQQDSPTVDGRQSALDAFLEQRGARVEQAVDTTAATIAAENALSAETAPRVKFTPNSESLGGRLARAGHESVFGGAFDLLGSELAYQKLKKDVPGLTRQEVRRAVDTGWEEAPQDFLATVGGALVGGAGFLSGAKLAGTALLGTRLGAKALPTATREGLVRAGMAWAKSQSKTRRILAAGAVSGTAGMAEEATRALLNETMDASAGLGFSGETVIDATYKGALAGMIGGAALQTAARGVNVAGANIPGVADLAQWAKGHLNIGDAQAQLAGKRLVSALRRGDETADQTIKRVMDDFTVQLRESKNPATALASAIPPEQLRKTVDVLRSFSGDLDVSAREMSEQMVKDATTAFTRAVADGEKFASPGQIALATERMFTNMVEKNANLRVTVPDDVINDLVDSRAWLTSLKGDRAAAEIVRVIDLKTGIDDIRLRAARARQASDIATARAETASIRQLLAEMLDAEAVANGGESAAQTLRLVQEGGAPTTPALARLLRYVTALDNDLAKGIAAGQKNVDAAKLEQVLSNMERDLQAYRTSGLRVAFSDANKMRVAASSRAYNKAAPPAEQDMARFVRDRVARIGQTEVPEYADAVRDWSLAMTRADAQDFGEAAVAGGASTADPREVLVQMMGRTPAGKRNVYGDDRIAQHQAGMREGALGKIQTDTMRSTGNVAARAASLADDPLVQQNLRAVAPDAADRVIAAAKSTAKTYDAAAQILGPKGLTPDAEEARGFANAVELGIISGVPGTGLGGAAVAGLVRDLVTRFKVPRGTARKLLDMLLDPAQAEQAARYMQAQGIDVGAVYGALIGNLAAQERESKE